MSNESIEQRHKSLEERVQNIEQTLKELKYFLEADERARNIDATSLRESILVALENREYRRM